MSRKKSKPFVKAADTDVPVEKSIEDIKTLVRRHGAAGFGVQEDYRTGRVIVSFVLNTEGGGHLPLQIPMDVKKVHAKMYGHPNDPRKHDPPHHRRAAHSDLARHHDAWRMPSWGTSSS